jgi:hypothetical protein
MKIPDELDLVSLGDLAQLIDIVVKVKESLINLHFFFFHLPFQFLLFFQQGLLSFLLCDNFGLVSLGTLSLLNDVKELKGFHGIH